MMCSDPIELKPDDTPTADLTEVEPQKQLDESAKEEGA